MIGVLKVGFSYRGIEKNTPLVFIPYMLSSKLTVKVSVFFPIIIWVEFYM